MTCFGTPPFNFSNACVCSSIMSVTLIFLWFSIILCMLALTEFYTLFLSSCKRILVSAEVTASLLRLYDSLCLIFVCEKRLLTLLMPVFKAEFSYKISSHSWISFLVKLFMFSKRSMYVKISDPSEFNLFPFCCSSLLMLNKIWSSFKLPNASSISF